MPYVDCPQFVYSNFMDSSTSSSDGIQVVSRSEELRDRTDLDSIKFRASIGRPFELASLNDLLLSEPLEDGKRALAHFVPSSYNDAFGRQYQVTHIVLIPSDLTPWICRSLTRILKPNLLAQARKVYYRQGKDEPMPPARIEYESPEWQIRSKRLNSIRKKNKRLWNLILLSVDAILNGRSVRIMNFDGDLKDKAAFFEDISLMLLDHSFSNFSLATTVYDDSDDSGIRIAFSADEVAFAATTSTIVIDAVADESLAPKDLNRVCSSYIQQVAQLGDEIFSHTLEHVSQVTAPGSLNDKSLSDYFVSHLQITDGPAVWKLLLQNGLYRARDVMKLVQSDGSDQFAVNGMLNQILAPLLEFVMKGEEPEIQDYATILHQKEQFLTEQAIGEIARTLVSESLNSAQRGSSDNAVNLVRCWKIHTESVLKGNIGRIVVQWVEALQEKHPEPFDFLEMCFQERFLEEVSFFRFYVSLLAAHPTPENVLRIIKSGYFQSHREQLPYLVKNGIVSISILEKGGLGFDLLKYFGDPSISASEANALAARIISETDEMTLLIILGNYAMELGRYEFFSPPFWRVAQKATNDQLFSLLTRLSNSDASGIALSSKGSATFLFLRVGIDFSTKVFPASDTIVPPWRDFLDGFVSLANSEDNPTRQIDALLPKLNNYVAIQFCAILSTLLNNIAVGAHCFQEAVECFYHSNYEEEKVRFIGKMLLTILHDRRTLPGQPSFLDTIRLLVAAMLRPFVKKIDAPGIAREIASAHVSGLGDDDIILKAFAQALKLEGVDADSSLQLRFKVIESLIRMPQLDIRLEMYIEDIDPKGSLSLDNLKILHKIASGLPASNKVRREIVDAIVTHVLEKQFKPDLFVEYSFKEEYVTGNDVGNWLIAHWQPKNITEIVLLLKSLRGKYFTLESKFDASDLAEQLLFRGFIHCDPKLVLDYLRIILKQPLTRWRNLNYLELEMFVPILPEYSQRKELRQLCESTMRLMSDKRPGGQSVPVLLGRLATAIGKVGIKDRIARSLTRK